MALPKPLWIAVLIGWNAANSFSQMITISGTVRDANTYREIRDVNIYVKGTQKGTNTDFAGRFELHVAESARTAMLVFRHVAYEPREIQLDSMATRRYVYMQPRVINLGEVEVREEAIGRLEIQKDLPQVTSLIEAKSFEIRGYTDAGDLLRTDHSVQVEENLSGKKTVAIRGGNPDEVVVLYNGIKLNSAFDNVFDLSLIDLEDIERFEIIKGSNTALYGPEAFSGVINIVPKVQQDYMLRFQQRLGTYRSGNWGLHLHQHLKRLYGSYSFKRGGTVRNISDAANPNGVLENTSLHHTANVGYHFSTQPDGSPANTLGAMYVYSTLDHDNSFDDKSLSNFNHLGSLKYSGDLAKLKNVDLSVSLRRLDEQQFPSLQRETPQRRIDDRAIHVDAEKRLKTSRSELTLAYQFQQAKLDFTDVITTRTPQLRTVETAGDLQRRHHGVVAIAQFRGDAGSDFFQAIDVDVSFRHDRVEDEQNLRTNSPGSPSEIFKQNAWHESLLKVAMKISGYREDLAFTGHLSFGKNAKFPTLFQQISSPNFMSDPANRPSLTPEKNRSVEIGVEIFRDIRGESALYGWQTSANYFQNYYDNKFRMFAVPDDPRTFYDNVENARISGVEGKSSLFLLRKKLTLELGLSRYFISEKAAFPFKADSKFTVTLNVDHAGYSFQAHWFKEGEQAGWVRQRVPGTSFFSFVEVPIEGYTNLDLHLSKKFELGKLKLFANASGRNLLNNDLVLQGLALRDRRFYLTMGAQY